MKKISFLILSIFLVLLAWCNNISKTQKQDEIKQVNSTNEKEQMVWWKCEYNSYEGKCKITLIGKANDWWYNVKYTFTPSENVDKNYVRDSYNLTLLNWENPSDNFIKKYKIEVWKQIDCTLKVIKKWTCNPTIIDLKWIDITDYQANKINEKYKNDKFSIDILRWWEVKDLWDNKIEILKNNYVLLINPKYEYAWGVEWWVFNSIIENLPRKPLIINYLPAIPCGTWINKTIGNNIVETDMIYSNKNYVEWACNKLWNEKSVWYLSYFSQKNSYFYANNQDNSHYIVLATYLTDNIENLPSENYKPYLEDIKKMVETLSINGN